MKEVLASKIAQAIRQDYLVSGRTRPDEPLPRLHELASEYNASIATIAHAIGQLQAMGYVRKGPGRRAYAMSLGQGNDSNRTTNSSIGLVIPGGGNAPILLRVYEGVHRACQRLGHNVVMASSSTYFYETECETVAMVRDSGCRAIILVAGVRTEEQLANDYLNREFQDIPIVLVDMAYPKQRRSQVVFDNYSGAFDMTRLLLSKGHRRIGFVTVLGCPKKMMWRSNLDRYNGYLAAMRRSGIEPDELLLWHCDPLQSLAEQAHDWLVKWKNTPKQRRASVLIGLDDGTNVTLMSEALDLGIAIPHDLTFAGFDNTSDHALIRQGYYTTDQDFAAAGEKAVDLAMQHLTGELDCPVVYMLPVPIVYRTSRRTEIVRVPADMVLPGGP